MANLSITTECKRRCSYCFAPLDRSPRRMTMEVFRESLELLARSGIDQVRLHGGEPSMHPRVIDFVETSLSRGMRVLVFTIGLMEKDVLRRLAEFPGDRFAVLLHLGPGSDETAGDGERIARALEVLGSRVTPGFTIDTPNPDLDFLIGVVDEYRTRRSVRLGLAHPGADGLNSWLHPKHYPLVGKRVVDFVEKAMKKGIEVELDCGFVPCMFGEAVAQLKRIDPATLGNACGSIPDILTDGTAVACYPLAGIARFAIKGSRDCAELRARLDAEIEPWKCSGIYPECRACAFKREGVCKGGCAAVGLTRLRGALPDESATANALSIERAAVPGAGAKEKPPWIIPYIDAPPGFWNEIHDLARGRVKQVYLPLPGRLVASARPSQKEAHVEEFLRSSPFPVSIVLNPIVLDRPVEEIAPAAIEAIARILEKRPLADITLANILLARELSKRFPDVPLTASALMDVFKPSQTRELDGLFSTLVPSSRVMRDLPALRALKKAFRGKIRLIVNEACLPDCPLRIQHFYEMASNPRTESLCARTLDERPWLRLTGAWVLPQHLDLYGGIYDELKLAGRVTLRDRRRYIGVLGAYLDGRPLPPNGIGGGPASVLEEMEISREFFAGTLTCDKRCGECGICRDYHTARAVGAPT